MLLVCAVVWFGAALPLPLRIAACAVLLGGNARWVRAAFLRRGPHAVRTLEWGEQGLRAGVGGCAPEPAVLLRGSCRLGRGILYLRLRLRDRSHSTIILEGARDPAAFRALCARIPALLRAGAGPVRVPADTMRPKV